MGVIFSVYPSTIYILRTLHRDTLFRKEKWDHAGPRTQSDERRSLENFSVAVYFGRHGDRLEKSSCGLMDISYRGCSLER